MQQHYAPRQFVPLEVTRLYPETSDDIPFNPDAITELPFMPSTATMMIWDQALEYVMKPLQEPTDTAAYTAVLHDLRTIIYASERNLHVDGENIAHTKLLSMILRYSTSIYGQEKSFKLTAKQIALNGARAKFLTLYLHYCVAQMGPAYFPESAPVYIEAITVTGA